MTSHRDLFAFLWTPGNWATEETEKAINSSDACSQAEQRELKQNSSTEVMRRHIDAFHSPDLLWWGLHLTSVILKALGSPGAFPIHLDSSSIITHSSKSAVSIPQSPPDTPPLLGWGEGRKPLPVHSRMGYFVHPSPIRSFLVYLSWESSSITFLSSNKIFNNYHLSSSPLYLRNSSTLIAWIIFLGLWPNLIVVPCTLHFYLVILKIYLYI